MTFARGEWSLSRIFLLAAVICFVLVAIDVDVSVVNLTALGLGLGFASFLFR